jgi:hypothetical protein
MDDSRWEAFLFGFVRNRIGLMHDDVTPKEVVDWLMSSWPFDKERTQGESSYATLRQAL